MELGVLVDPVPDLHRLAEVLDGLGNRARIATVRTWERDLMVKLYEACDGNKIDLDHFMPSGVAPLTEVIHYGKNSLPAFNIFEKRFAKPADEAKKDSLLGYNQQNLIWAIGAGYFEVRKAAKDGEVDIDYTKIPAEKVGSWPAITDNKVKLGRFVYEGMIDVMRKVSTHVSIGRATKGGKTMDAWFVLCREDKE